MKYTPLIFLTVVALEGLPLFAVKGQEEAWIGWGAVILGGIAGVLGWVLADSINTLKIRRGFPLTVVALTWGLLGGATVGFKFYATEVGGRFLPSTIIIAAVMGLVSGFTGSMTQEAKMPRGRWLKTALLFGASIGFIRFFDVLIVTLVFSPVSFWMKLWFSGKVGLLSFAVVAPLSLACLWLGSLIGGGLKPILEVYNDWWAALKEIGPTVFGFFIAYVVTVIAFAGQFWAAWTIDRCLYYACTTPEGANKVLSFGDFLYFSLLTMTTAGQGDVPNPSHLLTRALISLEIFTGVVLTTLLVSVLFTVVQRKQRAENVRNDNA